MSDTIPEAEVALAAARSSYLDELERDALRPEGSGAQEARREKHQLDLSEAVARCESALEEAKKAAALPKATTAPAAPAMHIG